MDARLARINETPGEKRSLDVGATSLCSNAIGDERHQELGLSVGSSPSFQQQMSRSNGDETSFLPLFPCLAMSCRPLQD